MDSVIGLTNRLGNDASRPKWISGPQRPGIVECLCERIVWMSRFVGCLFRLSHLLLLDGEGLTKFFLKHSWVQNRIVLPSFEQIGQIIEDASLKQSGELHSTFICVCTRLFKFCALGCSAGVWKREKDRIAMNVQKSRKQVGLLCNPTQVKRDDKQ